jgi:hypothetical protein
MIKWVGDLRMCCVEGARIEPFVLIPDVQTNLQETATLLIFSMGAVDAGALLSSAWLDPVLQPHHCRIKDWRFSLAVATLWIFSMGAVHAGALLSSAWLDPVLQPHHCRIKDWRYSAAEQTVCVKGARIELLVLIADALRMFR